jgi:hypothetical protein
MRKWIGRVAAVLFGLVLAILFLDVSLPIVTPLLPPPLQVVLRQVKPTRLSLDQSDTGGLPLVKTRFGKLVTQDTADRFVRLGPVFVHAPTINWIDRNSEIGFRVPSSDWQPRWPVDAVVVGDSFTFCFTEYADCWVRRLETDHGLSMVNLGQPATGSLNHEAMLETFGLPYEPRIVIWQWYGNDFNDDYGQIMSEHPTSPPKSNQATGDPGTTDNNRQSPISKWLIQNSTVYRVVASMVSTPQPDQTDLALFQSPYQVTEGNLNFAYGSHYSRLAYDLANPNNQQGFAATRQAILKARDVLAATHSRLVIVLIPTKEEVYRAWVEKQLGSAWLDTLSAGRVQMMDFCRDENLLCLDATPSLIAHASRHEQVYWPVDLHLNPLGNHILSDAVWDFLIKQGLAH